MAKLNFFNSEGVKFPKYLPEIGDIIQIIQLKDFSDVHECEVIGRRLYKKGTRIYRSYDFSVKSESFFFTPKAQAFIGEAKIFYTPPSKSSDGRLCLVLWPKGKPAINIPCEIKIVRRACQK